MKDIFVLTKILFKNSFGKSNLEKSGKISKIGKGIFLTVVFIYIGVVLGYFSYEITNALFRIRQEEVFISFSLLLICIVTLFRTFFLTMNLLYFSKDIEFLLPFPVSPIKIVFAKFNNLLISNYLSELIVFLVPYIVYWYILKLPISFLVSALFIFLAIPIVPMIISSLIVIVIMRFTSFIKNKDFMQYFSIFVTILVIIGVQSLVSSTNQVTDFMLANKINEINGYSSLITRKGNYYQAIS